MQPFIVSRIKDTEQFTATAEDFQMKLLNVTKRNGYIIA